MTQKTKSNLMLLGAAFIWGSAFVAQKIGGDIGSLTFNGVRNIIGGLFLIPVAMIFSRPADSYPGVSDRYQMDQSEKRIYRKNLLLGGFLCGIMLCAASTLQQISISMTTAGRAGFITSLYAVMVPVLSIVLGKKVRPFIWICVAVSILGLYMLSSETGTFRINLGDVLLTISALLFAVHIMIIDHFTPLVNGVQMSCLQFIVAGVIGLIVMFVFEDPSMAAIWSSILPILYAGVLSSGVAYTLQIVGLKGADPSEASLLLCLESVFSMLTGMVVLHERMPLKGYIGCLLIFAAVAAAQVSPGILPWNRKKAVKTAAAVPAEEDNAGPADVVNERNL